MTDLDTAARFIELNGRVLDARRFEYHFGDGADGSAVVSALRAYVNPDGGFGHGLEPDLRDPASQPGALETAFRVLDEVGRFDDPLVAGALGWLEAHAAPGAGVTGVLPSAADHPRARWWEVDPEGPPSLILTGMIGGWLVKNGVSHPWLDGAVAWLWEQIETRDSLSPYEARGAVAFLDHAQDGERGLELVRPRVLELVELDPDAGGEVHGPLDFAPRADSIARRIFDDAVLDAHLDALESAQQEDGGWMFNWPAWAKSVELEWRGALTVERLLTLRSYGRL